MNCPKCKKEIPDDILACSECGAEIDVFSEKDKKKDYTHYKIILTNPGPREGIVEILSEIKGLTVIEIQNHLQNLPWILESRLPLNKAQELKVMLETKRAVVKLEGMDIWEEEDSESAKDKTNRPDKRKLQWGLATVLFFSLISFIIYLLSGIDLSNQQEFMSDMNPSINIDQIEPSKDLQISPNISSENIQRITGIDYNLRDDGYNPYDREVIIRFDLHETTQVTVTLYDVSSTKIAVLLQANLDPDTYRLRWLGSITQNSSVNSGIYIVELIASSGPSYHKIVWLPDNR